MAVLENQGDIDVSYSGVETVISTVEQCFIDLKNKIEEMNKQKKLIPDYWESVEASDFCEKMDTVSGYFDAFCEHYKMFIDLLKRVLELYQKEEESIIEVLKKYEGKGSNA